MIDVRHARPERRGERAGPDGDIAWHVVVGCVFRNSCATNRGRHLVLFFERTDATLGDFYFTGGAPAITRYPSGNRPGAWAKLRNSANYTGLFSETVRIDRLAQ
ncbi:hypothetical protein ACFFYR_23600 [Paraburkholderia dipogonis]|uniref:hypothetical protein n=1 Tax=Paraburkholderia dipogonis TaxID=1211383 RepID=UPI0035EDFA45